MTTTTSLHAVLIDPRQPAHLDALGYDGLQPHRTPLQAGSLNVLAADGALLAIERVPVESVPHAIRMGTLTSRAQRLRPLTPWAYLILVGDLTSDRKGKAIINGAPTGWDWRSIQGTLATIQELGVIVLSCANDDRFGDLLLTLARHDRGPARLQPVRDALFTLPEEALLLAFPGIGEQKAAELLEQCGSVSRALLTLTRPDYAIAGIGPETIAKARALLGLAANEQLSLELMEDAR